MDVFEQNPDLYTREKPIPLIKKQGLKQFLHNYRRMQGKEDYPFKQGDEVEQMIVKINDKKNGQVGFKMD